MKIPKKWLKKNWIPLAFGILIIILWSDKSCDEASYKRDIAGLDKEISEKEADNVKKDGIIQEGKDQALAAQAVVVEKEANIEASRLRILELERREPEIEAEVMALPPSELVENTRKILECAQIELTENGILFSEECTRAALVKLETFSLIKAQLEETKFSLSESQEATQFQKIATWNVYRIAWAQGSQIMNYRTIIEATDQKYIRCEKQRKKSFWKGLKLGLAIGGGITVTFVLILPAIKAIF